MVVPRDSITFVSRLTGSASKGQTKKSKYSLFNIFRTLLDGERNGTLVLLNVYFEIIRSRVKLSTTYCESHIFDIHYILQFDGVKM